MADSPLCGCGQMQTVRHIVNECPKTKYTGDSEDIFTQPAMKPSSGWKIYVCDCDSVQT